MLILGDFFLCLFFQADNRNEHQSCAIVSYRRGGSDDEDRVDIETSNANDALVDGNSLHPTDLLAFSWQIAKGMVRRL